MASSIWSLTTIQTNLAAWIAADLAITDGQSYSINGRTLTKVNAAEISEKIRFWSRLEADAIRRENGEHAPSIRRANFNHDN